MRTSILPEIKKIFNMKARRFLALFSIVLLSVNTLKSQPGWVAPYPTTSNLTAINVQLNFQLDGPGTIYWVAFPYDTPPVSPINIKALY